jgi:hypothetical protein
MIAGPYFFLQAAVLLARFVEEAGLPRSMFGAGF